MNITAEQWITLLLLSESGSVGEVASRLHRGQPAISEAMTTHSGATPRWSILAIPKTFS